MELSGKTKLIKDYLQEREVDLEKTLGLLGDTI